MNTSLSTPQISTGLFHCGIRYSYLMQRPLIPLKLGIVTLRRLNMEMVRLSQVLELKLMKVLATNSSELSMFNYQFNGGLYSGNSADPVDGMTYSNYPLQNCSILNIALRMPTDEITVINPQVCSYGSLRGSKNRFPCAAIHLPLSLSAWWRAPFNLRTQYKQTHSSKTWQRLQHLQSPTIYLLLQQSGR